MAAKKKAQKDETQQDQLSAEVRYAINQLPPAARLALSREGDRLVKPGDSIELIKGETWIDDLSGIRLIRGFHMMADKKQLEDSHNDDTELFEKGYVEMKEQATAEIPKDVAESKLVRIEAAARLGIIKVYDPKNPTEYKEYEERRYSRVKNDSKSADGKPKYNKKRNQKIAGLLKLPIEKFEEYVSQLNDEATLIEIFNAEHEGMNPSSRVRYAYVQIIEKYMKTKRERLILSTVNVSEEEQLKIEVPK